MYEPFYNLHPTPFRLTPDPHFFFESETHKRGLAYLRYAFYQREGFVAITGAPGTGKTELVLNLIEELPHQKITLAKIVTTNLDADDLLDLVAASFLIDIEHMSKGSLLKKLENFFISQARIGKQVLLIIDEAHNLSVKSLLELSMLENFQIDEKPVMQCFLLGQLPLEEKLNLPDLDPLKQRVIASARLESLDQQETREYILHRLSKSGWDNNPIIHDEAFSFIHQFTKGVPRKVNSLCNRLLLHSYLTNSHEINAGTVHQVLKEIQEEALGGEALDLDFSAMQATTEFSPNSYNNNTIDKELHMKSVAQQPAMTHDSNNPDNKSRSSDDTIEIPEFIKKTQEQSSIRHIRNLKDISKPETQQSQWGDVDSKAAEKIRSKQKLNISRRDVNIATTNTASPQPTNRPSGLLDKELQFLSSLIESTTTTAQRPKPKDTTPTTAPKKPKQESTVTRKVIIDESVYEDHGLIGSNADRDFQEPKATIPIIDDWRQTALAAIVVGSLIVSISWLYEGDSTPANIVAETQSGINNNSENSDQLEVASTAGPVDIELPVISSPSTIIESTNEASSETSGAGVSATTTSGKDTTSVTDSSDYSDKSETGRLDTQLAQILEKTNAANNGPIATTEGEPQTNLASLPSAQHSKQQNLNKPRHNMDSVQSRKSEPPTTLRSTAPVNDRTVSTSKVTRSKSVAAQKNKPGSPLIESALMKPTKRVSPGVTTSTQRPDTMDTSISKLSTKGDAASQQSDSAISPADLTILLSRLSAAYETGNLQQLVTTFAPDIKSGDGSNRLQMLKEYQRLFNITDKRQLTIQDVIWSTKDRQMLGKGDFQVLIREKGATKDTKYQGKISFAVAKESNSVVIKKLDYDYGQ